MKKAITLFAYATDYSSIVMINLYKKQLKQFLIIGIGFLFLACTAEITNPQYPPIVFFNFDKIALNTKNIVIENDYKFSSDKNSVEQEFPVTPLSTIYRWTDEILTRRPLGTLATADNFEFRIKRASVIETDLQTDKTIGDYFRRESRYQYDGLIQVQLTATSPDGNINRGYVEVRRSITVPEDASLRVRQDIWYDFSKQMAIQFDQEMRKTLKKYFKGLAIL